MDKITIEPILARRNATMVLERLEDMTAQIGAQQERVDKLMETISGWLNRLGEVERRLNAQLGAARGSGPTEK